MGPREYLFITGVARSGSTLVARMLDALPEAAVASDPFFPLFRGLRDALVQAAGLTLPSSAPMQDYYFTDARIEMLDAVQAGTLDLPFDPALRHVLLSQLARRASVEAQDLVPHLDRMGGATWRDVVASALDIVRDVRSTSRYAGCKEVWTIELVPTLARAFPGARFVLLRRDPRAVLASLAVVGAADPTQVGHPLSYARHWRKEVAFLHRFGRDADLSKRIHVVEYERLVRDPAGEARRLCTFLEIPFAEAMLDLAWPGNSGYEAQLDGIVADFAGRWRDTLGPASRALAELVCGPEMELVGYDAGARGPDEAAVLDLLVRSNGWEVSWRSDLGDPQRDYELEIARRAALAAAVEPATARRLFLFPEVYDALRARAPAVA